LPAAEPCSAGFLRFRGIVLAVALLGPAFMVQPRAIAAEPPRSAAAAESPAPRAIRIIDAAPRRGACEAQVWPYIDSGCLAAIAERKREEAARLEASKRPRAATAALTLPTPPGTAARQSGASETDGSSRALAETEIKPSKAKKVSRESRRRTGRGRR
jgi:hypothetical protein